MLTSPLSSKMVTFFFLVTFKIVLKTWRRKWQPTPVFLPGKVHGQRSLAGCSPWGYVTEHVCTRVEGDGLGSNKLVELKRKKKLLKTNQKPFIT